MCVGKTADEVRLGLGLCGSLKSEWAVTSSSLVKGSTWSRESRLAVETARPRRHVIICKITEVTALIPHSGAGAVLGR